ncbi:hypothetical protein EYF80_055718 [Liparis tanakae]|uniref:Uncharacterized protein n=1 Tax=Liparis tanakae TaxID=230148 RepID=A0A4Z2EZ14_9TELE|nr:hypothetical protein EYF80_055718 [Liparis tanakae]
MQRFTLTETHIKPDPRASPEPVGPQRGAANTDSLIATSGGTCDHPLPVTILYL